MTKEGSPKSKKKKEENKKFSNKPEDELQDSITNTELVQIEEELEHVNPNVFEGIPSPKKTEILRAFGKMTISIKKHSGPLPDAETLIQYNSVIPNGADRIMTMAEKQQDHRFGLEKKAITRQLNESSIGQIIGAIIAFTCIGSSVYLAMNGQVELAKIIMKTTIIALTTIFVLKKLPSFFSKKSE